jgi:purine-nucleoside phosphorylase
MYLTEKKINDSIRYIKEKTGVPLEKGAEIGVILGSGLGSLADKLKESISIPYKDIPHFPLSTVPGHKGQLVFGTLSGKSVICLQGRYHYYQGYTIHEVVYPIRVMQRLGIVELIVTNSAGGINQKFIPGDLMLIKDHINLMGVNPLIGEKLEKFGTYFLDMSRAYSKHLIEKAEEAAKITKIKIQEGVYAALTGPNYETPAEINYLRIIGADAVGMSTVPEVIVANQSGINVLGISCITNMASGIIDMPLDHKDVIDNARNSSLKFIKLVEKLVELL